MINPHLEALFFACFDENIIIIKCQIKGMTNTILESHAYDNVLVIKYFCTTTIFSRIYVHKYSDFSNPGLFNDSLREQFWKIKHFSNKVFWVKETCYCKKIGDVIWKKASLASAQHCTFLVISGSKNSCINSIT